MSQAFTATRTAIPEDGGAKSQTGSTTNSTTKQNQKDSAWKNSAQPLKRGEVSVAGKRLAGNLSDDEILGLTSQDGGSQTHAQREAELDAVFGENAGDATNGASKVNSAAENPATDGTSDDVTSDATDAEPKNLRAVFDANPELRRAWHDANAYRETFATPEEARAATGQLANLGRMDALFFSRRPEDHAELARMVAGIDPTAFESLAEAMRQVALQAKDREDAAAPLPSETHAEASAATHDAAGKHNLGPNDRIAQATNPTQAQEDFFRATNAEAVQSVVDAIETQVDRLLPENISKNSRNRVVGEIYRELDSALRANPQFARQVREAFRSGTLDAGHQRAIVSLIAGRARQTLPSVAKRVLNEWTSTVVAANQDRRARQNAAERRIDIAGSSGSGEGRRSMGPRDVDYARMSDADILNL